MLNWLVESEIAMIEHGTLLSKQILAGDVVYLNGDLGAGKTTLVKGILRGLGHQGLVTSPTYTLVEPYQLNTFDVFHLDLYRLNDAVELENIGIREMVTENSICLIEWPDRGRGYLPIATINIAINYQEKSSTRKVLVKQG